MTDYKLKHCKVNEPAKDKKQFFAISDIHGHINEFKLLLTAWNHGEQTLVLLGDYVDRGQHSKDVLDEIIKLKEQYKDKVIVLLGNHDDAMVKLLEDFKYGLYTTNEINDACSFKDITKFNTPNQLSPDELNLYINFIKTMPLYHQEGKLLFTHAGFNVDLDDWRNSTKEDFIWIRNHFYGDRNKTGLVNIFGHTPGLSIIGHRRPEILVKREGFIGIDGGVFDRGRLNGIVVDEDGTLLDYYYARDFNLHEKNLGARNTFEFKD